MLLTSLTLSWRKITALEVHTPLTTLTQSRSGPVRGIAHQMRERVARRHNSSSESPGENKTRIKSFTHQAACRKTLLRAGPRTFLPPLLQLIPDLGEQLDLGRAGGFVLLV